MYDMINIFEVFLPQLLRYPNPTDPLNGEAAALMMREPKGYEAKVKGKREIQSKRQHMPELNADLQAEYVTKYATKEHVDDAGADTEDSDEMSSVGSYDEDEDEEPAGTMDEV